VRTVKLLLASSLLGAACSNEGQTTSKITEPRFVGPRFTEPQVVVSVAAIATTAVALQEDSPGLTRHARITDANARVIALQRVPGGRIVEAELERERGRLVYEYEIRVAEGRAVVKTEVDAKNGTVVSERRDAEGGG
jgi:hypothetical protein